MLQVCALLHQLSVLLARDPDVRLKKVVSKFVQPLVTICVAILSDVTDVTTTLKTVVFVSTLFRFVAKINDHRLSFESSAADADVVRVDVDGCAALLRAILQSQFLFRSDAQTTQAVVVAMQHILLVCPELREAALELKVPNLQTSSSVRLYANYNSVVLIKHS